MSDDMLNKIEALGTRTVSRRSFLRGGAIAAAVIGAAAALPAAVGAQQQGQSQDPQDKTTKKPDPDQDQSASGGGDSETKIDAQGREYRVCPQCGSNMYRQGRTWTCENCGYSYVE